MARLAVLTRSCQILPDADSYHGDGLPPAIFEVHGGPAGQSRSTFDSIVQYHVDRGVAVFEPNVRGSAGFGRACTPWNDRTRRLDSMRDLVDMLSFFRSADRVDMGCAAVSGGSCGGYRVNTVLGLLILILLRLVFFAMASVTG